MDYTIRVLCKCRDYGFRVYMDPHQDTVSFFPKLEHSPKICHGFPMRSSVDAHNSTCLVSLPTTDIFIL